MLKKKDLLSIIVIFAIGIILSGCSAQNANQVNPPSPPASNPASTVQAPTPSTTQTPNTNGTSQNQQSATANKPVTQEKPLAPEVNPTGDIPDSQAFVNYVSQAGGYGLDTPEGWARTTNTGDVNFQDKLDGVQVTISNLSTPPTVQSVKANQVAELQKTGRAVTIKDIKQVKLQGEPALLIVYESNSEPDPVTSKQIRLENNSYLFYKNGKLATLRLWAPLGADNVDQWNRMSNSFKWR